MKKMPAGEFKARCLSVMETVQKTKEAVIITKRGRPVAKLVPADEPEDDFLGSLEGKFKIVGDIESPVVSPDEWKVLR